jgi:hypothetical protein
LSPADQIAVASLAVAIAAFGLSIYAISRANKTTSAATLMVLNEGFRQAWERCLKQSQTPTDLSYNVAELLNLIEIACAAYIERSVSGHSRTLLIEYLNSGLSIIISTPLLNDRVPKLLQDEKTFIFIKKFLRKKKRRAALSVTVPPDWYELSA